MPIASINVIFRGTISKVFFGGEVDKVHHVADRQFHDGFAQVEYSSSNGPCLRTMCTAKIRTNGAQQLEVLKWPFGISQMLEDMKKFLGGRFVRYTTENVFKDSVVFIPVSAGSREIEGGC